MTTVPPTVLPSHTLQASRRPKVGAEVAYCTNITAKVRNSFKPSRGSSANGTPFQTWPCDKLFVFHILGNHYRAIPGISTRPALYMRVEAGHRKLRIAAPNEFQQINTCQPGPLKPSLYPPSAQSRIECPAV